MPQQVALDECHELDRFVAALENAYRETGAADLTAIAPEPSHPHYLPVLCELVRVDIEMRSSRNDRLPLDRYAQLFPDLFSQRTYVEAVTFEDYRQRHQAGEFPRPEDYRRHWKIDPRDWPKAGDSASIVIHNDESCETPLEGSPFRANESLPNIGDSFLGFELKALLGHGAFARVFLARQNELADRPVVLKISRLAGNEPLLLAQLQHTNIVPIYSVHRRGSLQAVCMPYYGGTTLADVIRELRDRRTTAHSGRALADTVASRRLTVRRNRGDGQHFEPSADDCSWVEKWPSISTTPCLQTLSGLSFVEAVLWIGVRLADGLAYAHERKIVHRDLKPANILLADDGQPMLLDFNLSQDRKQESNFSHAQIGGTLPYMAPETLRAFLAGLPGGDEQSDLYSLGLVLYELLTGENPYPIRRGELEQVLSEMLADRRHAPALIDSLNPSVSPAVAAILGRCLHSDPKQRYADARQLQEDLQCQLDHRPLRHTSEPSLRERGRKWLRRHPRLASGSGIAGIAAVAVACLAASLLIVNDRLATFEAQRRFADLQTAVHTAQIHFLDVVDDRWLDNEALTLAVEQAISTYDESIHGKKLSPDERVEARRLQAEALFLKASQLDRLADVEPSKDRRNALLVEALAANRMAGERAAEGSNRPVALTVQAAKLKSGGTTAPLNAEALLKDGSLASPRDVGLLAALLTADRRYREARPHWESVTHNEPRNVWGWYGLGHCNERLADYPAAAECYRACIALAPDRPEWYFRLGLVHLQSQRPAEARNDFTAVLQSRPRHADAFMNRALAAWELGDTSAAEADLSRALAAGGDVARVLLIRARIREQSGNIVGAKQDRDEALSTSPLDEYGWTARGALRAANDPHAALSDFNQALDCNPTFLPALESKAHVLSEHLDDVAGALTVLDEAVRKHPETASPLASRAVLLARQNKTIEAVTAAERALAADSSPAVRYQLAGVYALLSREQTDHKAQAFSLLETALRAGFGANLIERDSDLDSLRTDSRFKRLLDAVQTLHGAQP